MGSDARKTSRAAAVENQKTWWMETLNASAARARCHSGSSLMLSEACRKRETSYMPVSGDSRSREGGSNFWRVESFAQLVVERALKDGAGE